MNDMQAFSQMGIQASCGWPLLRKLFYFPYAASLFNWADPVEHFGPPIFHLLSFSSTGAEATHGRRSELEVERQAGDDGRDLFFLSPSPLPPPPTFPRFQSISLHGHGSTKEASAEERY